MKKGHGRIKTVCNQEHVLVLIDGLQPSDAARRKRELALRLSATVKHRFTENASKSYTVIHNIGVTIPLKK